MGEKVLKILNLKRDGSSHTHLGYNANLKVLGAGFKAKRGNTFYIYADVTQEQFDLLMSQPTDTIGKYFNTNYARNKTIPCLNVTSKVTIDQNGDALLDFQHES